MDQTTQNNPITFPARIYDGNAFVVNNGMNQSSDKLTTVMTDKNEVLGFQDGTSQQEMEHAIFADRNGSISEYKPTFYDKHIREPLAALGMDAFQPKFVSDAKPSPERAFATSFARAATADIFKPAFSDQESKANPAQSFAGGLAGSVAAFATGGALLDGFKLAELTPFAENIIKGGVLGGAYKGASETSNELRDSDHPDLAKIGTAVLHDSLWWGGISGVVGSVAKPVGVASAAGLGYLMAKSDGADEPSALLNGGVLAGFHLLSSHGDNPEVRQMVTENLQKNVADYILAKNPAVHPIVADRAGVEFIQNHAQDALEEANQKVLKKETSYINGESADVVSPIENNYFPRPAEPFTDGYDPKAMDFLSNFIPSNVIVRMSGTERLRLSNFPLDVLEEYKAQHKQTAKDIAVEKEKSNSPLDTEIEKMINEGSPIVPMNEVAGSKTLTTKLIKNISKQVVQEGAKNGDKTEGEGQAQAGNDIRDEGAPQGGEEVKSESTPVVSTQDSGTTKVAPALPEEGTGPEKTSGLSQSIETSAIKEGLVKDLGDLPSYKQRDMEEIADKVSEFINRDYDLAKKIALGDAPEQDGLRQPELFTGLRIKAEAEGDVGTLRDLALSKKASALATEAGQRVQALNAGNPDSAVEAIREVQKVREEAGKSKKSAKEKDGIIKDIKREIKKTVPTKETWASFIESIQC